MARKWEVDFLELLHMDVDGVCGLPLYMPYLRICNAKDADARCRRFVTFIRWASATSDFHWDYTVLPRYAEHLKSLGNAERTILDKISNIRQFLLAAEGDKIIPKCVYYAKRGRKPKDTSSCFPVPVKKESAKRTGHGNRSSRSSVIPNGFRKTFLYDLFGIPYTDGSVKFPKFSMELVKKSYRRLATVFHPDHVGGSHERFMACKDAYDFITDTVHRVSYELYVSGMKGVNSSSVSNVSSFVHSVYQRIGGYAVLSNM